MTTARCTVTGETFQISEYEQEYCRQFNLPLPQISPIPRLRQLGTFRNRTYLFHGTCAKTKKKILTTIAPEAGFTVWDRDPYESDDHDPKAFGRDYDFSKPFFVQFEQLLRQVPLPNLSINKPTMENSDYTNGITGAKNCYLIFSSSFNEDCLYSKLLYKCTNVVGTVLAKECQLCYACSDIQRCYNLLFSLHCHDCSDSAFLKNCLSCKSCFGCVNLAQAEYHFFNEPLSKADYEKRIAQYNLGSHQVLTRIRKQVDEFHAQFPVRYIEGRSNEGSTGQHLNNTKKCIGCYSVSDAEDLEGCMYINNEVNSLYHFGYGNGSRGIYNSVTVGDSAENIRYSFECWPSVNDLEYCAYCHRGTHDCFGSVAFRKAEYCILNKQYSRKDYFDMVERIKAHMRSTGEYGKFFPYSCSPYYFNCSEGFDWMPLEKDVALKHGFHWLEQTPDPVGSVLPIPDNIADCTDELLKHGATCEITGKKFNFQRAELELHRRMGVALSHIAPLERIRTNAEFLEVRPIHPGKCGQCGAGFETTYDDKRQKVLCEKCFQEALF